MFKPDAHRGAFARKGAAGPGDTLKHKGAVFGDVVNNKGAIASGDTVNHQGVSDREKHRVSQPLNNPNASAPIKSWPSFKKTAYLLLPLFIYFVAHDIAQFLLWAVMEKILSSGSQSVTAFCSRYAGTLQGAINGLAMLIGAAFIYKTAQKEVKAQTYEKGDVTSYCFLAAFAACVSVTINILFAQTGLSERSGAYNRVREIQYGVEFAAGLILYGIISPLTEEAVFRGILYNRMKRCFNYPIALILSSLFFGLYHGNMIQAAYGTLLGLLIAYAYEKYHNFTVPVLFHAVANISVFTLTYHNWFNQVSRAVMMGTMAVLLAVGGICLWQMRKVFQP